MKPGRNPSEIPQSENVYQAYEPSTVDEDGFPLNKTETSETWAEATWERARDKSVSRDIKLRRAGLSRKQSQHSGTYQRLLSSGVDKHLARAISRRFDPEFRRRDRLKERMIVGGCVGIGAAAVTGLVLLGIKDSNNPPAENLTPNERFSYDYTEPGVGSADCFTDTAYDLEAGSKGKMSVSPPSSRYDGELDILTITPVSGNDPLKLEGFTEFDHTISPVTEADEAIFNSYGCEVERY